MKKKYFHLKGEDKTTYVMGDLHGKIEYFKDCIDRYDITDCNIIIAGDSGVGFCSRETQLSIYKEFNKYLSERNISLYLIRGNHDDPSFFNRDNVEDEFFLSNIKLLPDYTVLTINDFNILMIGGATSIDRVNRMKRDAELLDYLEEQEDLIDSIVLSYWPDEQPFLDTDAIDDITSDGIEISYVITHSTTSFAQPITKSNIMEWFKLDSNLSFDLDNERSTMDSIYNYLISKKHPIKEWLYGHFHFHNQEVIDGITFTLLCNIENNLDMREICQNSND